GPPRFSNGITGGCRIVPTQALHVAPCSGLGVTRPRRLDWPKGFRASRGRAPPGSATEQLEHEGRLLVGLGQQRDVCLLENLIAHQFRSFLGDVDIGDLTCGLRKDRGHVLEITPRNGKAAESRADYSCNRLDRLKLRIDRPLSLLGGLLG